MYSSFLPALVKDFVQWEQQFGLTVFDQVRDSILSTHHRLPTLPLEFITVSKPPNRGCTLLNTSIEAHMLSRMTLESYDILS